SFKSKRSDKIQKLINNNDNIQITSDERLRIILVLRNSLVEHLMKAKENQV
ncbi:hypothetical protein CIHG_10559, partial [Coccidioides immitis H538.4]